MSQFSQIYADEPSTQQPRRALEKAHLNEQEHPSHAAVELGNPASFKPKYLVLDDINIDLITVFATVSTLISIFVLGTPGLLTAAVAAAIVFPLRAFFPRPKTPQGTVLITGASSGIGAELSYIFAEHGHDLVLVGRDQQQLENVKNNVENKYGKTARAIALDLSIPGKPKQLYDRIKGEGLTVEVLVNNAGLGAAGETMAQPIELAERMTTLNCIALVQLTLLFGNDMLKRRRGWFLHVSSVGGWMASPGQNIYHATKHYVREFSESLSIELRGYPGIVNTQLMPGPTQTQFITRSHAEETFMMAASGAVEDAKSVALAGYWGLRKGKRMVFSSWNAAFTATMMHLMPRSVHLTLASVMNLPLRGAMRATEPEKDQKVRGQDL